jgi:hypothetical protein
MSKRVASPSVQPAELLVGSAYFSIGFHGKRMLIPVINTYEYIGVEVDGGDMLFLFRCIDNDDKLAACLCASVRSQCHAIDSPARSVSGG